jgi:large subunit ribosomal protein L33
VTFNFLTFNLFYSMSQDNLIKLQCQECKQINYYSTKNKKTIKEKIELKKYCTLCKRHTRHKELKGK